MGQLLQEDRKRYASSGGKIPTHQKYLRKTQEARNPFSRLVYKSLFKLSRDYHLVELSDGVRIGGGLYLGHPNCITINPGTVIGRNVNLHKGVTIGQENRGSREGAPIIGDEVWIGINATVVGKIRVGNDVLIAPNSYVNCDIPDHSVVFGNPCVIKYREHATEGYINHKA